MRVSPLLVLLFCAGCAGYNVGPTNGLRAGERSIQINPPLNSTIEPRLAAELSQQLRKQIQRDGTYRLETRGEGDILLSTDIVNFTRRELAFQQRDLLTPRDYELNIYARAIAVERSTGKEILNRDFRGRTSIPVGNDLDTAERQARPLLAEDLARNIISALAEGEW